jgi:aldose 1-epimerase
MTTSAQNLNTARLEIHSKHLEIELDPNAGGSIAGFRAGGRDLLRPAPNAATNDPLNMACYPLLPFVGRIGFGKFRFDTQDITLPPHPIAAPHALHGLGWQRSWSVIEVSTSSAKIALEHDGEADWPWRFSATQNYQLDDASLTVMMTITNRASRPMPAGLGLHPFFPNRQSARLTGELPYVWESSADGLPTNRVEVTAVRNFARGRRIAPMTLDHCFSGGKGPLDISWDDHPLTLRLHGRDADHTVIYTPQAFDFFCVEPVTHTPNAVNRPEPPEITGLRILQPTETLQLTCRFEVLGL